MVVDQKNIDKIEHIWDIVIIGAGPAGSTAGVYLAEYGYKVLIIDKDIFPREKVCGDGIVEDAIICLKKIGLYNEVLKLGHRNKELHFYSPERTSVKIPGTYITLKRKHFDSLLINKAIENGAVFTKGKVKKINILKDGISECEISNSQIKIRARRIILATGTSIKLLEDLDMIKKKTASAFAVRLYVRSEYKMDSQIASFDDSVLPGYAWIFPLNNNEYNIGAGVFNNNKIKLKHLKNKLNDFLESFPICQKIMAVGEPVSNIKGHYLRSGLTGTKQIVKDNIIAIGESIGTTLPFSGEGIGKAMESAEIAAKIVHKSLIHEKKELLLEYPIELKLKLYPKYKGYKIAEKWISKRWLLNFVGKRIKNSDYLKQAIARAIKETADPDEIFSVSGILKSFWK